MINPQDIDLTQFLVSWYGPAKQHPTQFSSERTQIPKPLAAWNELSSQWPIRGFNRRNARDIEVSNGKATFMEDPSGDWLWSFDVSDPSTVYERELHGTWLRVDEKMPEFVTHGALLEALYGSNHSKSCTEFQEDLVASAIAPMTEISFAEWRWPRPGFHMFMGKSLLGLVGPAMSPVSPWGDLPGFAEVVISSSNPANLDYLEGIPNVRWT
jgi:hypothetical protein